MGVKITKLKEVDNCVKKDLLISRGRRPRTGKVFACPVCGKNFYLKPYQANKNSYTCQECGVKSGIGKKVELHPHHILSFTHYPKERFNTSNGKTLCSKCHIKHHKIHGYGKTKINQNT